MTTHTLHTTQREINVERTEVDRQGQRGGRPWTLYRVYATELDGTPINDALRTFDQLSRGRVEVYFEPREKGGAIESYTLHRADKAEKRQRRNGASGLEQRVEQLESEVAELRRTLNAALRAFGED